MTDAITTCKIEGCDKPKSSRGWCEMHYTRWRRYGDLDANQFPTRVYGTIEERFWPKVDASGDCWEWTAHRDRAGYGLFGVDGVNKCAHRVAWEILIGPITEGMELDHLCRNRGCVNPLHCEEVTRAENNRRGYGVGSMNALKTHCLRNHEFTPENTILRKSGKPARICRICRNAHRREYRRRKREAQREA